MQLTIEELRKLQVGGWIVLGADVEVEKAFLERILASKRLGKKFVYVYCRGREDADGFGDNLFGVRPKPGLKVRCSKKERGLFKRYFVSESAATTMQWQTPRDAEIVATAIREHMHLAGCTEMHDDVYRNEVSALKLHK